MGNPRMMNQMMPRGNFPPMNRMGMGAPQMRAPRTQGGGGGGLLARILGKGGQNTGGNPLVAGRSVGAAAAGGTRTGGLMKALTNPNALNGFLTNSQKVLNGVQQIGPMVEQYGPLVRNIPAMWKLYKGFKDLPSEEESSKEEKSTKTKTKTIQTKEKSMKEHTEEEITISNETAKGASIPKLYV